MSISSLTTNAWTPAARAQASDSVASLFTQPAQPSSASRGTSAATSTPASGANALAQMNSELQALLLQLQGGGTADPTAAAGPSQNGNNSGNATGTGSSSSGNDAGNSDCSSTSVASSDPSSVSAWLAHALQAYAPVAGLAGPAGALAASAIA